MIKIKKIIFLSLFCFFFMIFEAPSEGMTSSEKEKCHMIIHTAAGAAAASAAVMAQLPSADNVALMGILTTMTISLGLVFDVTLLEHTATSVAAKEFSAFILANCARFVSQWTVGWIPWFGNAINAATAAGIVEAVGWSIANHFDDQYGHR